VKDGQFREDLYFRLSGKSIQLPPLRERKDDIEPLAKFFLSQQKPRANKMLAKECLVEMQNYTWPGNVRELKRVCEQLALTSPLPVIREQDVRRLLSDNSAALPASLDKGLTSMVEQFEAQIIRQTLEKESDIEKAADLLQISRSSLYKKIKDYHIKEDL
jgi:transcriptional regulator with PAS, ATPase and Fis domain